MGLKGGTKLGHNTGAGQFMENILRGGTTQGWYSERTNEAYGGYKKEVN